MPQHLVESKVAVYGPTSPLKRGDSVRPVLEADGAPGRTVTIDRQIWFFWIDLEPFARFEHETLFVYVDIKSGAVRAEPQRWYPVVNDVELKPVDRSSPLWVYGRPVREDQPTSLRPPIAARLEEALSKLTAADQSCCKDRFAIVVNGDVDNVNNQRDTDKITNVLDAHGFPGALQIGVGSHASLAELRDMLMNALNQLASRTGPPLCQLVIYYTGHGSGGTMVFGSSENGPVQVAPSDLTPILQKIRACEIAIIMDACDSGQAIVDYNLFAMSKAARCMNLAFYAASEAQGSAWTDTLGGGSYTNALCSHLDGIPASQPLPLMNPASFGLPAGTTLGLYYRQTPQSAAYPAAPDCPCCPDGGTYAIGDGGVDGGVDGGTQDAGTDAGTTTGYCVAGPVTRLFTNWNGGAVQNGGTGPSFDTRTIGATPKRWCLVGMATYHYNPNNTPPFIPPGFGATPGTIGLVDSGGVNVATGPWAASGQIGQGNVPNAAWVATVPTSPPVVLNGAYTVVDSDPNTWSQNASSGGYGFAWVDAVEYIGP